MYLPASYKTENFSDQDLNIYLPIVNKIWEELFQEKEEEPLFILIYINNLKVKDLSSPELKSYQVLLDDKMILNNHNRGQNSGEIKTQPCYIARLSKNSEIDSANVLLKEDTATSFMFTIDQTFLKTDRKTDEIYKVSGGKIHTDVRGRIKKITEDKGSLKYAGMTNPVFNDNLILIDSNMDKIIAETLLYFYRDGIVNCDEMVEKLEVENPMGYGNLNAYRYKFKKFLTAVALGMKPATAWDGVDEATGGYIVVTKEGNILAYHIYNRNYFEEYLLKNTKYETASTSRHDFGEVYSKDGEEFINLNLQVKIRECF